MELNAVGMRFTKYAIVANTEANRSGGAAVACVVRETQFCMPATPVPTACRFEFCDSV